MNSTTNTRRKIPILGGVILTAFFILGLTLVIWGISGARQRAPGSVPVIAIGASIVALPCWIVLANRKTPASKELLDLPRVTRQFAVLAPYRRARPDQGIIVILSSIALAFILFNAPISPNRNSDDKLIRAFGLAGCALAFIYGAVRLIGPVTYGRGRAAAEGILYDLERKRASNGKFRLRLSRLSRYKAQLKNLSPVSNGAPGICPDENFVFEVVLTKRLGEQYQIGRVSFGGLQIFRRNPKTYSEFNPPTIEFIADDLVLSWRCRTALSSADLFDLLREIGAIVSRFPSDRVSTLIIVEPERTDTDDRFVNYSSAGYGLARLAGISGLLGGLIGAATEKARRPRPQNSKEIESFIYGHSKDPAKDNLDKISREFGWCLRSPQTP